MFYCLILLVCFIVYLLYPSKPSYVSAKEKYGCTASTYGAEGCICPSTAWLLQQLADAEASHYNGNDRSATTSSAETS